MATLTLQERVEVLAESIHRERHGDTCQDIHPIVHADQWRGFLRAAAQRIEVSQW
jgi:hypothetical protein